MNSIFHIKVVSNSITLFSSKHDGILGLVFSFFIINSFYLSVFQTREAKKNKINF